MLNSTFHHNSAKGIFEPSGQGGAINNGPGGTLTVLNSTFYDNRANGKSGEGGAILGSATVLNSTFYDNGALRGGAIFSVGTLTVLSSTFYHDSGRDGGGTATVKNTILVGNTDGSGSNNCSGNDPVTDEGYNLSNDTSCGFSKELHQGQFGQRRSGYQRRADRQWRAD